MVDDEGWTTIVKKQKKITESESRPSKYVYTWTAHVTTKDTTLTNKEQELIHQEMLSHPPLDIFCNCCHSNTISDIIRRSFFCNGCFCCLGYNYTFDDMEAVFHKYNKDYHFTKDKDFHTKC